MKQLFLLLLVVFASVGLAQKSTEQNEANCCKSNYPREKFDSLSIKRLATEYKRLKAARCQKCLNFASDFNLVMESLGKKLDGSSTSFVKKTMDRPDKKREGKWIYYWRGEHDYLYFIVKDKHAVKAAWYYAYE
jgi:hypothetical protein